MRRALLALLALPVLLVACDTGDPSAPGRYTYGRGAFAEVTFAESIRLNDGTLGFLIRCPARLSACRARADALCPGGYERLTQSLDGSGNPLVAPGLASRLQEGIFTIRCAGAAI